MIQQAANFETKASVFWDQSELVCELAVSCDTVRWCHVDGTLRLLVKNRTKYCMFQVLVEEKQVRPDGTVRQRGLPLSEKLMARESWRPAVRRAVAEELGSMLPKQPDV